MQKKKQPLLPQQNDDTSKIYYNNPLLDHDPSLVSRTPMKLLYKILIIV